MKQALARNQEIWVLSLVLPLLVLKPGHLSSLDSFTPLSNEDILFLRTWKRSVSDKIPSNLFPHHHQSYLSGPGPFPVAPPLHFQMYFVISLSPPARSLYHIFQNQAVVTIQTNSLLFLMLTSKLWWCVTAAVTGPCLWK